MERGLADILSQHTMHAAAELVRQEDGAVRCLACGHRCRIPEGQSGICRVRQNVGGTLSVPYGYVAGLNADPIEKKPFYHVLPGAEALSFGMLGCNLHCGFCQNWISSQAFKDGRAGTPPRLVEAEDLVRMARTHPAPLMVSTYNEPLITSDWAVEVFARAKEAGIRCGYVSNGNATPEVLEFIRPYVEFMNVDLKAFDDGAYRTLGCPLDNVLDTIRRLHEMDFWTEVVTLIVPGFNDDARSLEGIAEFIAGISPRIPWHVTAFHPDYRMTHQRRTRADDLNRAIAAGRAAGLQFIYAGNMALGGKENTYCPGCGECVVTRRGFHTLENRLRQGACPGCGESLPGIWR